jgi:hypothetical protein
MKKERIPTKSPASPATPSSETKGNIFCDKCQNLIQQLLEDNEQIPLTPTRGLSTLRGEGMIPHFF